MTSDAEDFALTPYLVGFLILGGLAILVGASFVFKGSVHA